MNVAYLAQARVKRLLGRLGALYEKQDAAEREAASLAQMIDETLLALDDARLEASELPAPSSVPAGGT